MRTLSSLAFAVALALPVTAFATPAAPAKATPVALHKEKAAPKAPTTKTTHHMKKDQKKVETPAPTAPAVTTPAK